MGAVGAYAGGELYATGGNLLSVKDFLKYGIDFLAFRKLTPDDFGSKYWITRGILDAHDQISNGGIVSKVERLAIQTSLKCYEAGYAFEKMFGWE